MICRLVLFAVLAALSWSASAQYRCIENGKTLYSDRPCTDAPRGPDFARPGSGPKVIGDIANSAYGTPFGTWRGQVQFQATGNKGPIAEALAVVPMTLDIEARGKVVGSSPENGCKAKGIASPGIDATMLNLDITLFECAYTGLNRRYFGSLIVSAQNKNARLYLSGTYRVFVNSTHTDIHGMLRR